MVKNHITAKASKVSNNVNEYGDYWWEEGASWMGGLGSYQSIRRFRRDRGGRTDLLVVVHLSIHPVISIIPPKNPLEQKKVRKSRRKCRLRIQTQNPKQKTERQSR